MADAPRSQDQSVRMHACTGSRPSRQSSWGKVGNFCDQVQGKDGHKCSVNLSVYNLWNCTSSAIWGTTRVPQKICECYFNLFQSEIVFLSVLRLLDPLRKSCSPIAETWGVQLMVATLAMRADSKLWVKSILSTVSKPFEVTLRGQMSQWINDVTACLCCIFQ